MTAQHIDAEAVLADLKDFQQRTARWAFQRMFADEDPAIRFLVADEVGLGKTHVAKGVIAQVIEHLRRTGDKRHDIVYVCSNAAIARQNIRKLVPAGIEPIEGADRLTMLPLAQLDEGDGATTGINLLPITPGTSLHFGRSTGTFRERCLAYTFLQAHWGRSVMNGPARRIFWEGLTAGDRHDRDRRLRSWEQWYRPQIKGTLGEFVELLDELDRSRIAQNRPTVRDLFNDLTTGLAWKRKIPWHLHELRRELIGDVRRVMARVGIAALQPDLIVLDEFQRFKDLLRPNPQNFAAEAAHRLFNHRDPETGRATRTLLLSATPYRMYTTSDETEDDHYEDFLDTCSFLFQDPARVERLQSSFRALRRALTSADPLNDAEQACRGIEDELRGVMARTERLAATPDRDGMLEESAEQVAVKEHDLRAYVRFDSLAEAVKHHEPAEYWKSAPYLVNFMEGYKFKEAVVQAVEDGQIGEGGGLDAGAGLLSWASVEEYQQVDPQNGRLRWLLADLEHHRAFELLWIPSSMRYYDTGSVYETPEAATFTKRLIFSGWTVVPKVVSSLVSFEAERRAFAARSHHYTDEYGRRGGQRLDFRTTERTPGESRPGEAGGNRRAASMTAFLLTWPSPTLAELGNPRQPPQTAAPALPDGDPETGSTGRLRSATEVLAEVHARVSEALAPLVQTAPSGGTVDRRWYWAAPLLLDHQHHPPTVDALLPLDDGPRWDGDQPSHGLRIHMDEARAMVDRGPEALGRTPDDLVAVLAELAVGGPAQCALRMISSVAGLPMIHGWTLANSAYIAEAFRSFFNAPEVTALVVGARPDEPDTGEGEAASRYWRDVIRHSIDGNLQAVLDEHGHVLRDWLGYLNLDTEARRASAADDIAEHLREALELRTSSYRVDIPVREHSSQDIAFDPHRMRTRFAVAFANQTLDDGGEARVGSVSTAFNSPFWPFVLTSTSIGQEGLDFHLWCHAVVHWNLPYNPVDLEQREGRVHRYKGHAIRRNIAAALGPELLNNGVAPDVDPWDTLFATALNQRSDHDSEMVPYWVFHEGPAKIERHVPVMPFSHEAVALPRLRKRLAAYRLAFGQARQEELLEFLGASLSEEQLTQLATQLRIDLSPPQFRPGR